ncbi:hypothetical protein ACH4S9_46770 [Streptomyces sp. NPDC021225]|uniref:hypothetical protein n=1 Tax=Streptomyces sp. NPDC021225 TaxID=3365121 RepID=UPI0037999D84
MAKPKPTQQPTDGPNLPPPIGRSLSVRILDEGMYDDLRVIMQTGCDASAAVRQALLLLSEAYYAAWSRGIYPTGTVPLIESVTFRPYRPVRQPDQDV